MFRRLIFSAVIILTASTTFAGTTPGMKLPSIQVETVTADRFDLLQQLSGKTGIIVLHHKESAEAARKWLAMCAFKWRADGEKVVYLGIADTSETGSVMRSFAASGVRREADRTSELIKYYYKTEKESPPSDVEKKVKFIADFDRAVFKALEVGDVKRSPVFIVTNRAGKVAAVFTENSDETYDKIKAMVETLLGRKAPSTAVVTEEKPEADESAGDDKKEATEEPKSKE